MPTTPDRARARLPARGIPRGPKGLRRPTRITSALLISGVTRDSGGSPLGSCTVSLFLTNGNSLFASTTSDASGNYSFSVPADISTYYIVAYKSGSPDVEGTSVNTLVGV